MMSLGKRSLSLLILASAALAIGVSACSGGGGGDDDDDGNTLPNPYDSCAIWFETFSGTAGEIDDLYLVFAPIEAWATGTVNFGPALTDPFAVIYADRDNNGGIAVGTAGTFSVTAPSNSLGEPLSMTDSDNNTYVVVGTAGITAAVGGQGSFDGVFNDNEDCLANGSGDPEDCIFDGGTISMTVTSSGTPRAITLGADVASAAGVSFAMCIDFDDFFGFAPQTRTEIIKKFGELHAVSKK